MAVGRSVTFFWPIMSPRRQVRYTYFRWLEWFFHFHGNRFTYRWIFQTWRQLSSSYSFLKRKSELNCYCCIKSIAMLTRHSKDQFFSTSWTQAAGVTRRHKYERCWELFWPWVETKDHCSRSSSRCCLIPKMAPSLRGGFATLFNIVLANHFRLEPDSLKTDFKPFEKLITLLTNYSY